MLQKDKYSVINIRKYLESDDPRLGEEDLIQILSEFSCEIIFRKRRNQEKPILQGLQRLWKVVRCVGFQMVCNTYATSMQHEY